MRKRQASVKRISNKRKNQSTYNYSYIFKPYYIDINQITWAEQGDVVRQFGINVAVRDDSFGSNKEEDIKYLKAISHLHDLLHQKDES